MKKPEKIQILQFLNQSVQSFSRIVTHALTSHVVKAVELSFFQVGYIAVSEAQIILLDVLLLILFVILSQPHDIQREKIEFEKYR